MSGLSGDVSGLRGNVSGLRGNVSGLRGVVSGLSGEVKLREISQGVFLPVFVPAHPADRTKEGT